MLSVHRTLLQRRTLCRATGLSAHSVGYFARSFTGTAGRSASDAEKRYSNTLQLPRTDFPLRANAAQRDSQFRERCTDRLYQWQRERDASAPSFTLHDGPPYANGALHIGHAMNKILKDIILRYKVLRGYRVSYIPGWDCHGLPIEQKVLGQMRAEQRDALSPLDIRERARKCAMDAVELQRTQFRSWAIMGDWENSYLTLKPDYEARQLKIFQEMVRKGLIYRHYKPVYWSPSSKTALAEAELEYREDHQSRSVYVHYPVSALIWTTTPWTLPANRAIAIGSSMRYTLVRMPDTTGQLILVASDRLAALSHIWAGGEAPTVPISGDLCPILSGEHVTGESGTGLVHTAPAHGVEDFTLCQEHNISLINCGNAAGAEFNGLPILSKGTAAVIDWIKAKGMLVHEEQYTHSYPYDWRSKQPVILRATRQWFANVTSIRSTALSAVEETKMVPEAGRHRLVSYLHGRSEWCISRQRSWGVPIPVFYDVATDEPIMNDEVMDHVIKLVEKHGSSCWWGMSTEELMPESYRNNGKTYRRGMDTMDVWFDSGTSWSQLPAQGNGKPVADVYLEGSDQHRGWFQSSLLTSVSVNGKAPFGTLITHGFTLDEQGRKMSKSLGNTIEPGLIDKKKQPAYGTDVLRLWVASTEYVRDVAVGSTIIANIAESMRKFRGTARFMLGSLSDFSRENMVDYEQLLPVDQYMLQELNRFNTAVGDAYENFAFNKVVQELGRFTSSQLSAFYFELIKDRLYADGQDSASRRAAQTVLFHVLNIYVQALAPIACHLAEEVHSPQWNDAQLEADWRVLRDLRGQHNFLVEQARKEKLIKTSTQTDVELVVAASSPIHALLERYGAWRALASECVTVAGVSGKCSTLCLCTPQSLILATVADTQCQIILRRASTHKCPRCWNYWAAADNSLCARCASLPLAV
ncbi:isoleucyl-tRNA synthetase [Thamnocephalis sphaerospora]|uniref:Isoleucine--tRNA ligase, mitochondrial n=1 Tax=Thamnocephalis sphaerospora TaxID=78915 RepID=A0A4P9XTC9_9FUNG|nr:isoleucyl-tRNA synthetase [Thamnocephalis sphaerospora]|eukprot:RKP09434.1 isoleucyl-tRNA synthetase [Thamnocephalis sphaerospora]